MFDRILAAGEDLGPILMWVVIAVFWAIAKALSAIKRNQSSSPPGDEAPRPARPARGGKTLDPTLKEFLETLTGQTIETEPAPTAPPARPVAAPPPRRPPPPIAAALPSPPPTPSIQEPVLHVENEDEIYAIGDAPHNVIEATEIGEHEHFQEQTIGSLSALAGMAALRMPMSSLRLPIHRENCNHRNPVKFEGRNATRQAMIARVVLGPPRCMPPDPEDQKTLVG